MLPFPFDSQPNPMIIIKVLIYLFILLIFYFLFRNRSTGHRRWAVWSELQPSPACCGENEFFRQFRAGTGSVCGAPQYILGWHRLHPWSRAYAVKCWGIVFFYYYVMGKSSVVDPGSAAFWPLDPGSGIGFFRILDLWTRIPYPYFLDLSNNLLCPNFLNCLKIWEHFSSVLIN